MRDWFAYATGSGVDNLLPFLKAYFDFYYPSFAQIRRHTPSAGRILEVGVGIGFFGMWLAAEGYQVTQIDIDPRIVEMVGNYAKKFNVPADRLRTIQGDARSLGKMFPQNCFDLSFSSGLIEHFDEYEATEILRGQSNVSRRIVTVVPGRNMKTPRTDERYYDMRSLRQLHEKAGLIVLDQLCFGDEPMWLHLFIPLILQRFIRRHFEYGSTISVVGAFNGKNTSS